MGSGFELGARELPSEVATGAQHRHGIPMLRRSQTKGRPHQPLIFQPKPMNKRKCKVDGSSMGRRRKASRGPELPRALVKEMGYDVPATQNAKGHEKKKATSAELSATKHPTYQAKSVHNDPAPDSVRAELQMQAMLAKKLKLKKGQSRTGPDDGLDGLLEGFEDINGAISTGKSEIPQSLSEDAFAESDDPGFMETGGADTEDDEDLQKVSEDDSSNNSHIGQDDLDADESLLNSEESDSPKASGARLLDPMLPCMEFLSPCSETHLMLESAGSQGAGPSPFSTAPVTLQNERVVDRTARALGAPGAAAQFTATDKEGTASKPVLDRQGAAKQREPPSSNHPMPQGKTYIPPALRAGKVPDQAGVQTREGPGQAAVRRQIRSFLNRVAAANLTGIASEIACLFGSMPRNFVIKTIVQSLMQALEEGPRAADQFAAVMSCLIVMVSALSNVQELLANTMLALADGLEKSRTGNDSIASSNTTRVICCLYLCKGIGSKVMYSLLEQLKEAFSDGDVHLILLMLNTVGYELRADDAVGMKAFIESVHAKSASRKAENALSQRARLMLELIVDIKNNRKRKVGGVHAGLEASVPAVTLKQLKECNADAIALHHITWAQLCSGDHRGMWWLSTATTMTVQDCNSEQPLAAVAAHPESSALLQLASKQRMNTDSRGAIFCVLMSADDHMDAVERLMRLPLKGTADRDIAHVLLHCCMQEERWNPFYGHVAAQLLAHGKTYRNSIQFAVQDRLRRIAELNARQATNLASFMAHLLAQQGLPMTMFKVIDLEKHSKRSVLFCRCCMQRLLLAQPCDDGVRMLFSKLQSSEVKAKLLQFFRRNMGPWVAGLESNSEQGNLLLRIQAAEAALRPGGD